MATAVQLQPNPAVVPENCEAVPKVQADFFRRPDRPWSGPTIQPATNNRTSSLPDEIIPLYAKLKTFSIEHCPIKIYGPAFIVTWTILIIYINCGLVGNPAGVTEIEDDFELN